MSIAVDLTRWACELEPYGADLGLADRALADTVAVWPGWAPRWAGHRAGLGTALGWAGLGTLLRGLARHLHGGAPASAVGASIALGLPADQVAMAMALAVPGAGGVQRAFGTDGKALQVGLAVESGMRAARLAAAGARADPAALDDWLALVGGDAAAVDVTGPTVRTLEGTVVSLIRHRPQTGLEGKFSLEYAAAAALLDTDPGFGSFTDAAVRRDAARRLAGLVEVKLDPGGTWLLDGQLEAEVHTRDGAVRRARQQFPPGAPARPPSPAQLADCVRGLDTDPAACTWISAVDTLRQHEAPTLGRKP